MNSIRYLACATAVLLAVFAATAIARPYPVGEQYKRNGFVHMFEWRWSEIEKECVDYLGPAGFWGVQVSPVVEHVWNKNSNGFQNPWWIRYQPISYAINSRSGNESEFRSMVETCNKAGVKILVDMVINHMGSDNGGQAGYAGSRYSQSGWSYPPDYSYNNFHHASGDCCINTNPPSDYDNGDVWRIRNCRLSCMPDLDHSSEYVRAHIAELINKLVDIGVAGIRIDAAKHIDVADIQNIWGRVNNVKGTSYKPYLFMEVIDSKNILASDYFAVGAVTEFNWGNKVGEKYNSYTPGQLISGSVKVGEGWGLHPSDKACNFLDNHDNQRGSAGSTAQLTFKSGDKYLWAQLFTFAYPYGHPKTMSSYEFSAHDQGPPTCNGDLACPRDDSRWIKEHRWEGMKGIAGFRSATMDAWSVDNVWVSPDNKQFAFSRGKLGFFAQTVSGSFDQTLQTGMPAGKYCDVIRGELSDDGKSCTGQTIEVGSDGKARISFQMGKSATLAFHHMSKVGSDPTPQSSTAAPKPFISSTRVVKPSSTAKPPVPPTVTPTLEPPTQEPPTTIPEEHSSSSTGPAPAPVHPKTVSFRYKVTLFGLLILIVLASIGLIYVLWCRKSHRAYRQQIDDSAPDTNTGYAQTGDTAQPYVEYQRCPASNYAPAPAQRAPNAYVAPAPAPRRPAPLPAVSHEKKNSKVSGMAAQFEQPRPSAGRGLPPPPPPRRY